MLKKPAKEPYLNWKYNTVTIIINGKADVMDTPEFTQLDNKSLEDPINYKIIKTAKLNKRVVD